MPNERIETSPEFLCPSPQRDESATRLAGVRKRTTYLSNLIERDDIAAFCDAIKKDLHAMGATPRDTEIIDDFQDIVHDQGVSREAKEIATDLLRLIY